MFAAIAAPTTRRMEEETAIIALKKPQGLWPEKNATILAGTMKTPTAAAPTPDPLRSGSEGVMTRHMTKAQGR